LNPASTEIRRRRTFAIISHPDAGKTTLTEKLLLYGGALQMAGSVTARKKERSTTSDWMELEAKRGISVSSTVMQFDYKDYIINLVDTPGHEDFSEDTFRVLTAVDAAIMVVDAAKGIEAQTRKLFAVCRMRNVPIFTFINKCDRPGWDPIALLDEIESLLGIQAYAVNWPIGRGFEMLGVFDRLRSEAHFFKRVASGSRKAEDRVSSINDPFISENLSETDLKTLHEEMEMIDMAGASFDAAAVLEGKVTPVYFGSAVYNYGVQLLLDGFLDFAPIPRSRQSGERIIQPEESVFSGFVFKIQANMDPHHRDRIAFVRVCSGRFSRDMSVTHVQSGRKLRLAFSHKLFGRERETQDEAWPGDVIGLAGQSDIGIGDTLTEDPSIRYDEIPRFAPECFAFLRNEDTSNYKRYRAGIIQLLQEKVIQSFREWGSSGAVPLLGAVGPLQFDVVKFRMESEYRAPSRLEMAPYTLTRWVAEGYPTDHLEDVNITGVKLVLDDADRPVFLFEGKWNLQYFQGKHPTIPLLEYAPDAAPKAALMQ
jgi:peptide chain release factor 3